MPKTAVAGEQLRKGAKVEAAVELRGVPAGTKGKVQLVNGFAWVRYWVLFENGVSLGSIDRSALYSKADLEAKANGTLQASSAGGGSDDGAGGGDGGDEGGGGGVTTPNGTFIPQKFIDRAAAARARLAA